jgi:hypothetical protein
VTFGRGVREVTASSEYILKTLEKEFTFYRSSLQTSPYFSVYVALLSFFTLYSAPIVLPHSFEIEGQQLDTIQVWLYWLGLAGAWSCTLGISIFGILEKKTHSFDLGKCVRSIEQEERQRINCNAIYLTPKKIQNIVMEIVRIRVAEERSGQISIYKRLWGRRVSIQVFLLIAVGLCVSAFVFLVKDHHTWLTARQC